MKKPEVWMRGPVPEVPALLQPAAHALLQSVEEVETIIKDFDDKLLWTKPAGMASVGFHLRHLSGVVDRLLSYARGATLSQKQLEDLEREGQPGDETALALVARFKDQVDVALGQLRLTPSDELLAPRGIGRKQIPTNMIGLIFHAAEHSQRHVGQLLVTAKWVSQYHQS
ncbi:DinB family protein [Chryseolinea sp. T2]|uniref:DinB family protein n=1 Tax=Chryseolinea sp. T2 TaxID=3129255 RepID=UPI0030777F0E